MRLSFTNHHETCRDSAKHRNNGPCQPPSHRLGRCLGSPFQPQERKTAGGTRPTGGKVVTLETSAPQQSERGAQHYRPTSDSPMAPAKIRGPENETGPQRWRNLGSVSPIRRQKNAKTERRPPLQVVR